ncbi:MAG: hypothetical protein E6H07_05460 [Bacteroidetes bacterium]|nr:MAG: hypothetical protein E6H07_05460 [Bacteroidota bacterium]
MNNIITHPASHAVNELDSFEKGFHFENYMVTLFNKRKFRLLEWRGDKIASNGVSPLSNSWPDLVFASLGKKKFHFAVECKWRKQFFEGGTDWADRYKIDSYLEYQRDKNMRVYVAIGVGGTASNPEKLFVTPLDHISMYPFVYQSRLIPFKKNPEQRIDDAEQLELF